MSASPSRRPPLDLRGRLTHLAALTALLASSLAPATPARAEMRPIVGVNQSPLVSMGTVVQVGEILVFQGDDEIVTDLGGGELSISPENLTNLVQRFYLWYPDEFDALAFFTSFPDPTNGGAYAICSEREVQGLGLETGGCPGGSERLLSVTNMNDTDNYATMGVEDDNWISFMGQEFGHSWLSFWSFLDPMTKEPSLELLGRDGSHYAPWVHADGSFMDGVSLMDNGDGTFTITESMVRFSKLDLYGMGIIPPEEVEPFFFVRNAMTEEGPLPENGLIVPVGTTFSGDRVDITIEDIVAASGGPRVPAWDANPEEFRHAFILITRPGETAAQVAERIAKLEVARLSWEDRFATETEQRGFVCTDVTARCPRAVARVSAFEIVEAESANGNGILEPKEDLIARIELWNTGGDDATTATGSLVSDGEWLEFDEPVELPVVAVNERKTVDIPFRINSKACGEELTLTAVATIEARSWKSALGLRPGIIGGTPDPFATDAGWTAENDADTATQGRWEYGVPKPTFFAGRVLQPMGGHGGTTDKAWFTQIDGRWDEGELAGGETYLTTAPYDTTGLLAPTLKFWLWYVALDRTPTSLLPAATSHLLVQGSSDGGTTWVDLQEITGGPYRWQSFEVPVGDKLTPGATTIFRFVARDDATAADRLVEIGIDDVQLDTLAPTCTPEEGGGCGCRVAPKNAPSAAGSALLALAMCALVWRRRRQ